MCFWSERLSTNRFGAMACGYYSFPNEGSRVSHYSRRERTRYVESKCLPQRMTKENSLLSFFEVSQKGSTFGAGERDPRVVRDRVLEVLHQEPSITSIDYVNIRDAKTFEK